MKVIAVTQARSTSTRLPGKVLLPVGDESLLGLHLRRIGRANVVDEIVLATTTNDTDDGIVEIGRAAGVRVSRGSENDVLDRFYQAVREARPDFVVRLTSDCPLIDPALIDGVVGAAIERGLDYYANTLDPGYPDGQDIEVFTFAALEIAWREADLPSDREHVTPFIWRHSTFRGGRRFRSDNHPGDAVYAQLRMTVDEPADYELITLLSERLGNDRDWRTYAHYIMENKNTAANQDIARNEGYDKSRSADRIVKGAGQDRYERAKKLIPGGTMLLSKRPEMFLPDLWPAYFDRASGDRVWDLDGKEYLDMSIMGIGTNLLGYGHPKVDEAVRGVVTKGNMSTFNCPEEVDLAERLVALNPWADMVRLCRTGGEANAVAIRIARAASGRDKVAICGYHGWHDWYLSTNLGDKKGLDGHLLPGLQPNGVPRGLAGTVLPFRYNQLEELKNLVVSNPDIGVIKMEVSRNHGPEPGFLEGVRQLATDNNIVLIFDECTSGFRETLGGLHLKYGVEPDMAMYGKALGNGYAITATVGRREVMEAAQKTFISSTFWTERIGPAAALATLRVMEETKSWERVTATGKAITERWKELATAHDLPLVTAGLPALTSFSLGLDKWQTYKTFITQEMLKVGILASNSVYVCTEHSEADVDRYFGELDKLFRRIRQFERGGASVEGILEGPVSHQGFKRLN